MNLRRNYLQDTNYRSKEKDGAPLGTKGCIDELLSLSGSTLKEEKWKCMQLISWPATTLREYDTMRINTMRTQWELIKGKKGKMTNK